MSKLRQKIQRGYEYFLRRILKIPYTMAVRFDACRARKPELTIVFLHGIAASFTSWRPTVQELAKDRDLDKVRFIGLDLIGFGKSPRPEKFSYEYEDYRRVLTHTIKKLHIKTPIILAGHSMGCLFSMDYAENGNIDISQLILVSPPVFRQTEVRSLEDRLYNKAYRELNAHTDNGMVDAIARFVDKISSFEHRSLNTHAFRETMAKIVLSPRNWQMARNLRTNAVVLHGRVDPLVNGQNLRTINHYNPHFQLIETFGGHDITGYKQRRVVTAIKETALKFLLQEAK